jgi:L-alanine-DL-glutamate epimerase-like enolase superfamily enzyme
MKITKIETFTSKDKNLALVKLTTADGRYGWGQLATYFADVSAYVLHRQVAPLFLGREISEIESLVAEAIISQHKFLGSHICRAVAGIETAALDWLGKDRGVSVCEYLGGKPEEISVYGSSMSRKITPEDEADRVLKLAGEKGFRAFKIRIGSVHGNNKDAWEGRTESIVPILRKAVGDKIDLLADANSCYTPDKAIEIGHMLEDHGIFHFEEPCPHMEMTWTEQVTRALKMDVAGGEQDNVMATWKMMIDRKAVDIVQPDILYIGGMYRALEVARQSQAKGLTCTPHAANHSLVTLFTAHLLGAVENRGIYMEYSIEDTPWVKDLYEPFLSVENGKVKISGEPGWGIRIKDEWLKGTKRDISEL